MYDLASLTKILATLPLAMQLYDDDAFDLDTKLKEILPEFKHSNKANILIKDLLSHQAQLQAWEPFYQKTLDSNKKPSEKYYKSEFSSEFSIPVAKKLFLRTDYTDTIFQAIIDSKLLSKKQYKYSDFAFIILKKYIEKELDNSLDNLANERFYKKIGANSLIFNPLNKMDSTKIIPTEIDTYFRQQEIKGYVHDMAAAMFGGVSGHAGLFGNSLDVAKMMQLYLNKGVYGDTKFFSAETFDIFNTCHFCEEKNRRGLGFDKPQLADEGPTCGCTTKSSFGHTGFTGTMAWADPEKELIYIFLSNRTYPDGSTNKLSKENIREKIQKIIYDSLID
jgi:CubicO group peptidase (beta-lactamase class C family)